MQFAELENPGMECYHIECFDIFFFFFDERLKTEILALVSSVCSGKVRRVTKNALRGKAIRAFLIAKVNIQKSA